MAGDSTKPGHQRDLETTLADDVGQAPVCELLLLELLAASRTAVLERAVAVAVKVSRDPVSTRSERGSRWTH